MTDNIFKIITQSTTVKLLLLLFLYQCSTYEEFAKQTAPDKPKSSLVYRVFFGLKSPKPFLKREYYLNQKIKSETKLTGSQLPGSYTSYYRTGELKEQGQFEREKKEGTWTRFYKTKGAIQVKQVFRSDTLHGQYESRWTTGKVQKKGVYQKGEKVGQWTLYDSLGNLIEKNSCFPKNPAGKWVAYYSEGQKKEVGKCEFGKRTDVYKTWYRKGWPKKQGQYSKGQKEGLWKGWYPSGNIKFKTFYIQGNYHDSLFEYFETGEVKVKGHFKKGTGKKLILNEEGKLNSIIHYVNGQKHGFEWEYHISGLPVLQVKWKMGKPEHARKWVVQGIPPDTLLQSMGVFNQEGRRTGVWKWWNREGVLVETAHYRRGVREGPTHLFHKKTGKLIQINHYSQGVEVRSEVFPEAYQ